MRRKRQKKRRNKSAAKNDNGREKGTIYGRREEARQAELPALTFDGGLLSLMIVVIMSMILG